MTANAHQAGIVLRELGLSFDLGFMLLNPWSTVESVMNNIEFLGAVAGDGATAVNFCRMLPYVGTPAAERLLAEGRLERDNLDADYSFLDPRLDHFYEWAFGTFADRNQPADGTLNLLRLLSFEAHMDLDGPVDELFVLEVQLMTTDTWVGASRRKR
jgi:anaerobic magnesium-protoporphyrin IX monomethyl ester cyclase